MSAKWHRTSVVVAALAVACPGMCALAHAADSAYPHPLTHPAGDQRPPAGHDAVAHGLLADSDPVRLQSELAASRAELKRAAEQLEVTRFLLQQAREALARNYSETLRQRALRAAQEGRLAEVAALETELAQLRAANRQLQARATSQAERQDLTESGYRSCQDRLAALDADLGTARAAGTASQQRLAEALEARDRLHAELAAATAALQEREDALTHANASATAALAQRDALQAQLALQEAGSRTIDTPQAADAGPGQSAALAEQLAKTRVALDGELAAKAAMQRALADAVSTRERLLALLDRVNGRLADISDSATPLQQGQAERNPSQELLQACNERLAAAMVALSASALSVADTVVADSAHPPAAPQATDLAALESTVTDEGRGDRDADGIPDRKDLCPDTPVGTGVDATGCVPDAPIALSGINFRYDSEALTDPSRAALDRIAGVLIEQPTLRLEIAGHTDAQGDAAYNLWLSEQRAKSVMAYLVTRGVEPERLMARGYGGTQPIAANSTREGLARNRRVELRRQP